MSDKICLADFITLQRGFDLPSTSRVVGPIPVVASTGVSSWHNVAKVKAPGVVIGRSGSIGGGQYIEQDFWPLNTTLYVKDFKGNNPKYVYYVLRSIDFSAFNAGAGVPTLNRNHIASIEIDQRTRVYQDRVVDKLAPFDAAIANCRKQIALLEEAAMRLYREWFGDGKGEKGRIGDFVRIKRGKVITKANAGVGSVPVIAAGIAPAYFNDKANVLGPSVTISASGANAGYVWFHPEDIWASDCSYVSRSESPYVYFCYTMLLSKQKEISKQQKGSAQPHVHASDVEGLAFEIPEVDKVEKFERCVTPQFEMIGDLSRQIRSLTEARDRLLPKLMSGEVAV